MRILLFICCLFLSILADGQMESVSLGGLWGFKVDRYELGKSEGWQTPNYPIHDWEKIKVHGYWDTENNTGTLFG